MAKLQTAIVAQSNIDTEESDLTSHGEFDGSKPQGKTLVKTKRNFEVSDLHALYAVYPQFFKLVPDYAKIRQAMKLGLDLPGLSFFDNKGNPEDDSVIEDNSDRPLQRL